MAERVADRNVSSPALAFSEPSDYERLIRFIVSPERRFALAIARCTNPTICSGVMTQATIDAEVAGTRVATVDVAKIAPDAHLLEELQRALRSHGPDAGAVFVVNLDALLLDATGAVH